MYFHYFSPMTMVSISDIFVTVTNDKICVNAKMQIILIDQVQLSMTLTKLVKIS